MATEASAPEGDLNQVAHIISSYARHHQLGPEQLVELIRQVHRTLASLGQAALPMVEPRQPAVPIRRSVQPDYVVCLKSGFAPKPCAGIYGWSTGSVSTSIGPAGICGLIIR